jgi:hypothetical protein
VAAVSAVILTDGPQRHAGKVYDLYGPAAVTMDEIAGYISAALGMAVEYHHRTEAQQRAALRSAGLPGLLVDVLLGVDTLTRDDVFAVPSPTVFDLTGTPHVRSRAGWRSTYRCSPRPPHSTTNRRAQPSSRRVWRIGSDDGRSGQQVRGHRYRQVRSRCVRACSGVRW